MDWIELAHVKDRLAGACECGNKPSGSIKCGEFLDKLQALASQERICFME
jgi:hypothetical protein